MIKNLDYAVHMAMQDLQETDTVNYQQYLQWAIFCLTTEVQYKYSDQVKTVYLPMSEIKTVDLPPDYLVYTKIGYLHCGKIITLTLNQALASKQQVNPCSTLGEAMLACDCNNWETGGGNWGGELGGFWGTWTYMNGFRNGQYVGENYGLGGGFNIAYYNVFPREGIIQLSGDVPHGIVALEYKSSGIEADGSILIDLKLVPAIRQYIHYQRIKFSKATLGEKQMAKNDYDIVMGQLAAMNYNFTLSEYLDVHYRSTKLSPKR